jgi:hypothetical protein
MSSGRLKVFLLCVRIDGTTTDNDSWLEIEKIFSSIEFSITSVNFDMVSRLYPSTYIKSNSNH